MIKKCSQKMQRSHVTESQTKVFQSLVNMVPFVLDRQAVAFENQRDIMWLLED